MRPYVDFKNKWVGKKVDYDKWAGYQCVDLFKQYMDEVLGIKLGKSWSAKQIRKNSYKIFNKTRTQHPGTKDLMQGDIICSYKWKFWHIAIFDHYAWNQAFVLEQNGSGLHSGSWVGSNAIRVHWYALSFWAGTWRCQKIFDNLELERAFIDAKLKSIAGDTSNTLNYRQSIRYVA